MLDIKLPEPSLESFSWGLHLHPIGLLTQWHWEWHGVGVLTASFLASPCLSGVPRELPPASWVCYIRSISGVHALRAVHWAPGWPSRYCSLINDELECTGSPQAVWLAVLCGADGTPSPVKENSLGHKGTFLPSVSKFYCKFPTLFQKQLK